MAKTVADALGALRDTLKMVSPPAPAAAPVAVWAYPADHLSIDLERLDEGPLIIVGERVNVPRRWGVKAAGVGLHDWEASIVALLVAGQLTNHAQRAEAEKLHSVWAQALADVLLANQTLRDSAGASTADGIGDGDRLFDYRIGHLNWWGKVCWGLRAILPVRQTHIQSMTP